MPALCARNVSRGGPCTSATRGPLQRRKRPYARSCEMRVNNVEGGQQKRSRSDARHLLGPTGHADRAILTCSRSKSQGYIYVGGQIGQSADTGKLIDGGTEQQTEQIFANLFDLLEACGRSFQDIVRSTVYLTSM